MVCFAEVVVGFDEPLYQFEEGNLTRICVELVTGQILPGLQLPFEVIFNPIIGKNSS